MKNYRSSHCFSSCYIHKLKSTLAKAVILLSLLQIQPIYADESKWTLNFKDADLHELIKFVADATGKTVVIDPLVRGKVKVISSKTLNTDELYELFLSILEIHGFVAVESGDVLRIVPKQKARTSPITLTNDSGGSPSSEVITHIIQLDNISADKLIPVLKPLVPDQSHMAAYAGSNAIIIADTMANIQRIKQVIQELDRKAVIETEAVSLKYAFADDVIRMLGELTRNDAASAAPGSEFLSLVSDQRTNRIFIGGDELTRQRVRNLIRKLDVPARQEGNVRVLYLEYAKAQDLAATLTKVLSNIDKMGPGNGAGANAGATIEADEETNALIITADEEVRGTLETVVSRLDIPRAQVLVEAIIVEMLVNDTNALGIEWLYTNERGSFAASAAGSGLFGAAVGDRFGSSDDGRTNDGLLSGVTGQALGYIRRNDTGTNFAALITALKDNSNANILSTPTLLTLDNSPAVITVGQEVPFITGSFSSTGDGSTPNNPFQTIERENVGISLEVTPQLNEGDSVVMGLVQEVSSLSGVEAADVVTNERRIESQVMAKDGQIVVLGGLIEDSFADSVSKVPLLGDIPWLGRLFRSSKTVARKTNLMVFIRATIIRDEKMLSGASAEKYRYIRDQQIRRREVGVDFVDEVDLPLLPEWQVLEDAETPEPESKTTGTPITETQTIEPQSADTLSTEEPVLSTEAS